MTQVSAANTTVMDAPVGRLAVQTANDVLTGIDYVDNRTPLSAPATPLARDVVKQLKSYFRDASFVFDLPLQLDGTPHQQEVWRQLRKIRSGDTMTYGDLALRLKSGARAVGNSCRRNPISIVVPCHRVVAAGGIGGYGGHVKGKVLDRKHWLLRHEGLKFAI